MQKLSNMNLIDHSLKLTDFNNFISSNTISFIKVKAISKYNEDFNLVIYPYLYSSSTSKSYLKYLGKLNLRENFKNNNFYFRTYLLNDLKKSPVELNSREIKILRNFISIKIEDSKSNLLRTDYCLEELYEIVNCSSHYMVYYTKIPINKVRFR